MKYAVIIPAYNEEHFLPRLLNSLASQHLQPTEVIVVDDGSVDGTAEVVHTFAQKHSWLRLVQNDKKEKRASGAKVVRAFYLGYQALQSDYDFLSKLDADLELPPNYFERIAEMFSNNDKLGIAGGTILIEHKGKWVYEHFSDTDHVKGAYKSWRKKCFEDIGGLRPSIGWDTCDEMLARYHNWEIETDTRLQVKHYRVLGTETGSIRIRVKVGNGMYRLRYGFLITLISAAKAGYLNKPYILTGLAVMWGWFQSWLNRDEFMVSKEEGRFIRNFRWKRMRGKLS